MSRPNGKIAFGISAALWFFILLIAALAFPNSLAVWQMWVSSTLICLIICAGGWAYLSNDEAQATAARQQKHHDLTDAQLDAQIAKAQAEAKRHRLEIAQTVAAFRQLGMKHNRPTPPLNYEAEWQEFYRHLFEHCRDELNGSLVFNDKLEHLYYGKYEARLATHRAAVIDPLTEKKWLLPGQMRKAPMLAAGLTLDRLIGHIDAGDLPPHPDGLPPKLNWYGKQEADGTKETSEKKQEARVTA